VIQASTSSGDLVTLTHHYCFCSGSPNWQKDKTVPTHKVWPSCSAVQQVNKLRNREMD